jgi:hypothetical protein
MEGCYIINTRILNFRGINSLKYFFYQIGHMIKHDISISTSNFKT